MSKTHRLTGIGSGGVDTAAHEINFVVDAANDRQFSFVMKYGVAAQIIGALARMFSELRQVMYAAQGMEAISAEEVASSHVQQERWKNMVLMQLTTPAGIPYTFLLTPKTASEIAEQLKIESAKPFQPTGSA